MTSNEMIPALAVGKGSLRLISESPAETFRLGRILGEGLRRGDCVALMGELGAGKTCLTQGIASGLGVSDRYPVTSPTFTLINEYPGKALALYHMDVYRLIGSADLHELGYDEYLCGNGVTVVEWAEKIQDAIPDEALVIEFSYLDENVRSINIFCDMDRIRFWERTLRQGGG